MRRLGWQDSLGNGDSDTTITRSMNNINSHVDGKIDVRWSWFGDT